MRFSAVSPAPVQLSRIVLVSALGLSVSLQAFASLIVGVVSSDGIVIATDSRLNRVTAEGDHQVVSDREPKLVIVQSRILVAMGGRNRLDGRPVWQLVEEIGAEAGADVTLDDLVAVLAERLSEAYRRAAGEDAKERAITVLVAGYQADTGRLIEITVPEGKVTPRNTTKAPGMTWCGDGGVIPDRLILGVDKRILEAPGRTQEEQKDLRQQEFVFPLADLPVADVVELAILTVKTSIEWSRFISGTLAAPEAYHPTVGGPIDAAVVTPQGAHWIQRKDPFSSE